MEADMRRKFAAVVVGIVVAVAVIFAVFDERVSFKSVASLPMTQSHNN
jgi:hypothetical protein